MVVPNKIEDLHLETQGWKSHLQFVGDEMYFIEKLLNSYSFEPWTANLFEWMEQCKHGFVQTKKERDSLKKQIIRHGNHLGGIFECAPETCDNSFYERHHQLQHRVSAFLADYLALKTKIYDYVGSVMKRKKPGD